MIDWKGLNRVWLTSKQNVASWMQFLVAGWCNNIIDLLQKWDKKIS